MTRQTGFLVTKWESRQVLLGEVGEEGVQDSEDDSMTGVQPSTVTHRPA